MADSCCAPPPLDLGPKKQDRAYRLVLFTVLAINAVMFGVEVIAGLPLALRHSKRTQLTSWVMQRTTRSAFWSSAWLCAIALPRRSRRA